MAVGFARLTAALVQRLREWRSGSDPRLAHQPAIFLPPAMPAPPPAEEYAFDLPADLSAVLYDYLATRPPHGIVETASLVDSEAGRRILDLAPADRVRMVVAAYHAWASAPWGGSRGDGLRHVVADLLHAKPSLTDADAVALAEAAACSGFTHTSHTPNQSVLDAFQRHVAACGLGAEVRGALESLLAAMDSKGVDYEPEGRRLKSRVEALLAREEGTGDTAALFTPRADEWGAATTTMLVGLPGDLRCTLHELLTFARRGGKSAKPSVSWLQRAAQRLERPDRAQLAAHLLDLVECHNPATRITLENREAVRGLIWLAALASPEQAARRLEVLAQKCLTDWPEQPDGSLALGNAAIHAWTLMPGTDGVASLTRLRRRLRRPGDIKAVDKALTTLADARGVSVDALEQIGLPDYGFASDGSLVVAVGSATAVLATTETNALETTWRTSDGKSLKGPPANVKANHADALKAFKAKAKEIGEALKAQCARLERLYLEERQWPLEVWRARYLGEPLVSSIARRLIWSFRLDEGWVAGLPRADGVFGEGGIPLDLGRPDVHVRLWHPMQSAASQVQAWRHQLTRLGITQPFRQAHREIYVLTDAERATHGHSNRFAGHIVQQHLFRALCQTRGWSAPAFGNWSGDPGRPTKRAPAAGFAVAYWVEPVEEGPTAEQPRFPHLGTGPVRFATSHGEPLALAEVPPVLFSELMRDVDLFVSVASIGNDPAYGTRAAAAHGEYWTIAAFGALGETAKTRHAVLRDLLPGLAIADRCRLEERFLVVTGKLRTYRIHLGSSNIQMEPNNQYLCIVQGPENAGGRVRLPFEGDGTLSLILSKAFLLADDDKITDRTILSQIKRG